MMRALCSDCGIQYEPPGKFLLDVLEAPKPAQLSQARHSFQADVIALSVSYMSIFSHLIL